MITYETCREKWRPHYWHADKENWFTRTLAASVMSINFEHTLQRYEAKQIPVLSDSVSTKIFWVHVLSQCRFHDTRWKCTNGSFREELHTNCSSKKTSASPRRIIRQGRLFTSHPCQNTTSNQSSSSCAERRAYVCLQWIVFLTDDNNLEKSPSDAE